MRGCPSHFSNIEIAAAWSAERKLKEFEAAEALDLSAGQVSRLRKGDDIFGLDRLIDAAAHIGITVRMTATRPYGQG